MEFIETSLFTKLISTYLTEAEYLGLQVFLLDNPEAGRLVPGSGGVRKLRWGMTGKGKRGGARVIYYFKKRDNQVWFLTIYGKSEVENIPAHVLRQIAKEVRNA